jgi:hypothetical protein
MVQTAVTKIITTISEAERRFNLARTTDPAFFSEWYEDLPHLTEAEQAALDRIRNRYRYHQAEGHLAEGVVNLIVLSPLLELAGFYDAPFKLRAEVPIEVETTIALSETGEQTLRGRIDFLVVQHQLWIALMESKGTELNLEMAIPQTLAYMMANPDRSRPAFGMVTNGGEFFFLKLSYQELSQYDISDVFSYLPLQNKLYQVLQVLKRIGQRVGQ